MPGFSFSHDTGGTMFLVSYTLEQRKAANFFLVDTRRFELVGALVLATVGLKGPIDYTVINGSIAVEMGRL